MPNTPKPVYTERGWITSEGNSAMITMAITQMNNWRDAASLATKPGAPPELIEEALSQKKTLDELLSETKRVLSQTKNGLNESLLAL